MMEDRDVTMAPGLCLSFRGNSFHGQCQVPGLGSVWTQPPRGAELCEPELDITLMFCNVTEQSNKENMAKKNYDDGLWERAGG